MDKFTHFDNSGKATMVDVSAKKEQLRIARASGHITLNSETISLVKENILKKGDVLTVAQIAGINGAKQTSDLIPLCHNIILDNINVVATLDQQGVRVTSEIVCNGKTGAEMEALTSVSIALLTIYDMCKAVDKNMVISTIHLVEKIKK